MRRTAVTGRRATCPMVCPAVGGLVARLVLMGLAPASSAAVKDTTTGLNHRLRRVIASGIVSHRKA